MAAFPVFPYLTVNRLFNKMAFTKHNKDGVTMPESFKEQGEIIWEHLGEILASAKMNYSNLVSIRTYLASPEYDEENVALRKKYLGDHQTTLTVVCAQMLDSKWKLEVEAMAVGS